MSVNVKNVKLVLAISFQEEIALLYNVYVDAII